MGDPIGTAVREHVVALAWEEHRPALLRYATALLGGDRYAAEDVVQEAILRLWNHGGPGERIASLRGWLMTVVRNLVVDRSRRRAARPTEVAESPSAAPVVDDGADRVLGMITLRETLGRVDVDHRAAVVEVYVRDRSVRQAAAALGVPEGTVKSRCHYALRTLRDAAGVQ